MITTYKLKCNKECARAGCVSRNLLLSERESKQELKGIALQNLLLKKNREKMGKYPCGRGTNIIINAWLDVGLPEPLICEEYGGVGVTFLKDIFTEDYLKTLDLNERQVKSVLFTKEKGEITNSDYQDFNSVNKSVAAKELQDLTEKGLFIKIGTTELGTKYILSGLKQ